MRSICNIDYMNPANIGASTSASDQNEIIVSIQPLSSQTSNLRVELSKSNGTIIQIIDVGVSSDLIWFTLPSSSYSSVGTIRLRLLSDQTNSDYITFNTSQALASGDTIYAAINALNNGFEIMKYTDYHTPQVIDNLSSASAIDALSANQGRVLNEIKADKTRTLLRQDWWKSGNGNDVDDLMGGSTFVYSTHAHSPTSGSIISFSAINEKGYPTQIIADYSTGKKLFFRTRNGDTGVWNAWRRAITGDADVTAHMTTKGGYLGFDETTGGYLRTPSNGLLPNISGGNGYVGTSGWPFNYGYFNYGYIKNLFVNGKNIMSITPKLTTSGNWRMYAFPSGLKIATYYDNLDSQNFVLWGGVYESVNYISSRAIPSFFSSIRAYSAIFESSEAGFWTENQGLMTTTKTPMFYACRGAPLGNYRMSFKLVVIGD